jgi:hypothetical protein
MKKIVAAILLGASAAFAGERKITVRIPTENLDEFRRVAELAKELGANHVWATQIEPSMWIWNRDRYDPYPNWNLENATVFKFVVPDKLKKWFPADYAKRNFDTLAARGKILREHGLLAQFQGNEPAFFPEEAYRAHPLWRGPRCDQARRARHEYYAPCMDCAEVREMYSEAVKELCKACPFDSFSFLANDSGGGLCWAEGLYAGENGPARCKGIPMGQRISKFLSIFQDAAMAAGLGSVEANVFHIGPTDEIQSLPSLKPGQSVNNRTMTSRACGVGVGRSGYGDYTFPVWLLPRLVDYARGLQRLAAAGDANLSYTFRSLEDVDAIEFVKRYHGKIAPGEAAAQKALEDFAASRVGKDDAATLAGIWNSIERICERVDYLETGGHAFMLGTVHQRWLTRPFVAFPERLKPEERDYYRAFQFQAQTEDDANDMADLQANKWLKGHGAANLVAKTVRRILPIIDGAIGSASKLATKHASEPYGKELKLLVARLRAYRIVIRNMNRAVSFQDMMDRCDRFSPPKPDSPSIGEQGDRQLAVINQLVRDEIDESLELAALIDSTPGRIFDTAPTKELTSVMHFEPDLSASLRKKAEIMENHRRDFLRLYRPYNR